MPVIDWTNRPRRFMNPGELEVLCGLISTVKPKAVLEFGSERRAYRTGDLGIRSRDRALRGHRCTARVRHAEGSSARRGAGSAGGVGDDGPRFQLLLHPQGSAYVHPTDLPICDAAFIDGDHSRSGVLADTMLSLQVVRKGGLIIWHDYHTLGTVDVKSVLDEKQEQGWPLFHVENTWIVFMSA
jgi:hypothetical protein